MKKTLIALMAISIIVISFSCSKSDQLAAIADTQQIPKQTPQQTEAKSFIKDLVSDGEAPYFISGEFDGYKVYCASTLAEYYPANDTTMNAMYFKQSIDLDNIHLLRENRSATVMIAIYFDKAKIDTRIFPYVVPRPFLDYCESVQMEFINMKKLGTAGQCSPQDDFTFLGHTNSNIKVVVTSFINDVMEGSFEGSLTTKTGSTVMVKNGSFRIKIKRVNMGT